VVNFNFFRHKDPLYLALLPQKIYIFFNLLVYVSAVQRGVAIHPRQILFIRPAEASGASVV
jgi:hypothetical protein